MTNPHELIEVLRAENRRLRAELAEARRDRHAMANEAQALVSYAEKSEMSLAAELTGLARAAALWIRERGRVIRSLRTSAPG